MRQAEGLSVWNFELWPSAYLPEELPAAYGVQTITNRQNTVPTETISQTSEEVLSSECDVGKEGRDGRGSKFEVF